MRKRKQLALLSTAVLIAAAGVLSACSGSESKQPAAGTGASTGNAEPVKKTKLQYWTADRHDMDYIKSQVDKFNQTNKDGIEVELKVMAENYDQSVDVAFQSNQAPDIIRVGGPRFIQFYKKNYLEPLDAYLSENMKKRFADLKIEELNTMEGKIYSLPNYGQTSRLIYNVELFEKAGIKEPPKSLAEMVEAAKKITQVGKANGAYGIAANLKSTSNGFTRFATPIAALSGVPYEGYDFKSGQFDFSSFKEIAKAYRQMIQDGSALPGTEALDIDPLRAQFAEGKLGMYISVSAEPGVYNTQFPAKIKWASAMVPTIDGKMNGASSVNNAGAWLAISKNSANKQQAYKFLEFMYNEDLLKEYYAKGLGVSIVPSVLKSGAKPALNGIDGFLPTKHDAMFPVTPASKVEGTKFQDAFIKYMLDGGDLDKIVADLNTRYNAGLAKDIASGAVKEKKDPSFDPAKLQGQLVK